MNSETTTTYSELPMPFRAAFNLNQLEEMRERATSAIAALEPWQHDGIVRENGILAGISYTLGEGELALAYADAALDLVEESRLRDWAGYLLLIKAAALCYLGRYADGKTVFEAAEAFHASARDQLGMAWMQHLYAREYLRDQSDYPGAVQYLATALPVLRTRSSPEVMITNLLAQVDCMIRTGELRRAHELLQQLERLINENKFLWQRPELYLLCAELSLAETNFLQATQYCYTGLGAVSTPGDLRMLTPLYTTLATSLETDRSRLDDARDALERAINAGRTRARRLHLALAMRKMGQHLRRHSNRSTVRARGSGFLFEADQMLKEMGLSKIYSAPPRSDGAE